MAVNGRIPNWCRKLPQFKVYDCKNDTYLEYIANGYTYKIGENEQVTKIKSKKNIRDVSINLERNNKTSLEELAKTLGLKGVYKFKKQELIDWIEKQ